MHPATPAELKSLAEAGELDARIAFAERIGNHRGHAVLLKSAWERTFGPRLGLEAVPEADVPPPAWRGMPTTGVRKTFALLIEFQDDPHRNSPESIGRALFGRPGAGGTFESLAAYYERSSYRGLDLYGGATIGWYHAAYRRADVDQSPEGRVRLIEEALTHFHSLGHDFSQYDTNGDGIVDYFMVLWAGEDTKYGSFWWAYEFNFEDEGFALDGVGFGPYAWMWESRPVGSPFDVVTAIHETGHALGVPDLYDGDPERGPPGGVGGLDMMDHLLQYDHNCFSKWLLGWVTPMTVTQGEQRIALRPSSSSPDCVLIWPRVRPDAMFAEFFMVEHRARDGNDAELPGDGLVIWHIDARIRKGDFACDNSRSKHKLVRLMEADGREQIEKGQLADAGDFYQAGMSFGATTFPSSKGYRRARSGVTVRDITREPGWITATFAIGR
ncbi:MAG TPA: M6 family metalloprotease domain-containing protein [Gemmatimonadales bacterium]|jgi:M6 family metalloprotease domain